MRPNILLVTCHDAGRHFGCYGVSTVQSPNVDRLAEEGVRFENAFCTAPQCSPARSSLFTGRYPHCNGVMGLTHGLFGWDLNPGEPHLAGLLKAAGWATGVVGWTHEAKDAAVVGFDYEFKESTPEEAEMLGDKCMEFLQSQAGNDAPFFLHACFIKPHRGASPSGFSDRSMDSSLGVTVPPYLVDDAAARAEFAAFQGAIREMDDDLGRLLDALDELGIAENTIVVFTPDHGIPFPRAKCSLYDPGLEVALIMRWPAGGWTGNGTCFPQLVSHLDVTPTLLEILGLPVPAEMQGHSFAPLLDNQPFIPREEVFGEITYHGYFDPRRCIRSKTHKLIVNFSSAPFFMDPSQSWRPKTITKTPEDPANTYHEPVELYDLMQDPLETSNLALSTNHQEICEDLLTKLSRWMHDTYDPLLSGAPVSPMYNRAMGILTSGRIPSNLSWDP